MFMVSPWTKRAIALITERAFYAPSPDELPSREELGREVETVRSHLIALRKAPQLAPYTGPAILMPRAAGGAVS